MQYHAHRRSDIQVWCHWITVGRCGAIDGKVDHYMATGYSALARVSISSNLHGVGARRTGDGHVSRVREGVRGTTPSVSAREPEDTTSDAPAGLEVVLKYRKLLVLDYAKFGRSFYRSLRCKLRFVRRLHRAWLGLVCAVDPKPI
jgi:hypothetical protein